jgi:hypothetical protein
MTAIRYDIIPGDYYCAKRGKMIHPHGFADGVLNADSDTELKAHCDKNLVNYGWECEKTGKFLWNGITYYASANTLKQIEKKFDIKEVFTDKDLRKKEEEAAEKLRKLMATEEWLENKVLEDSARKFGTAKQYQFVQKIRDENPEIAHARMTRVTQKFLKEEFWISNSNGIIVAGPKFPKEKLPKVVKEEKSLFSRRARRKRS